MEKFSDFISEQKNEQPYKLVVFQYSAHYVRDVEDTSLGQITELLQNYRRDGIHFDYIRFHDSKSGMNPVGLKLFLNYNNSLPGLPSLELNKAPSFSDFQKASITSFIRKASLRIRAYQPNCIISAAVKPNLNDNQN